MKSQIKKIEADAAKHGVTMTDVCRRAGVNHATWWRWKTGKTEPRTSKLEAIRKALNHLTA
jgi:transcriptional regulator with XRE-family HTH domain